MTRDEGYVRCARRAAEVPGREPPRGELETPSPARLDGTAPTFAGAGVAPRSPAMCRFSTPTRPEARDACPVAAWELLRPHLHQDRRADDGLQDAPGRRWAALNATTNIGGYWLFL